jgi:hypothetical protein
MIKSLRILNSDTRQEYGLLETDFQEEIEKITLKILKKNPKNF